MRIIITGGSGFIGSHSMELFRKHDLEVVNIDLYEGRDICDYYLLKDMIEEGDRIIHLAALSRFASSDINPARTMHLNPGGTLNVIKAAIEKKAERIVYASTGSVYIPVKEIPIKETHPTCGASIYGHSKLMGEEMIRHYATGKINHIVLRLSHVYGAGKDRGGVHQFISRLKRGLKPTIYGGSQSNDMVNVKDVAQAILLALQTENVNEIYNIGSGEEINIRSVYNIIQKRLGTNIEPEFKEARITDIPRFVYDISRARKLLGYNPQYSFVEGINDMLGD